MPFPLNDGIAFGLFFLKRVFPEQHASFFAYGWAEANLFSNFLLDFILTLKLFVPSVLRYAEYFRKKSDPRLSRNHMEFTPFRIDA